ncbi:MAG: hypothetical protein GF315_01025 [candidate division Zixibacteria bacterium]|nr:hypothetical protein [candidate division Zixibacteria bacterium]
MTQRKKLSVFCSRNLWLIIIGCLLIGSSSAFSQYFGRNKIQYEDFDFEVASTDKLEIYYYENESRISDDVVRMADLWYDKYSSLFNHRIRNKQPLIIYSNHPDFQQTNVIGGMIPQGTGGVTEGLKNRVVLPLTGVFIENHHVIGHELIHAFQFSIMKTQGRRTLTSNKLPLWFVEGMSEYFTLGSDDALTSMWMRDAVLHENVPDIDEVGRSREYFPYRYGHSICAYIAAKWGDQSLIDLYKTNLQTGWLRTFTEVLGRSKIWRFQQIISD